MGVSLDQGRSPSAVPEGARAKGKLPGRTHGSRRLATYPSSTSLAHLGSLPLEETRAVLVPLAAVAPTRWTGLLRDLHAPGRVGPVRLAAARL